MRDARGCRKRVKDTRSAIKIKEEGVGGRTTNQEDAGEGGRKGEAVKQG